MTAARISACDLKHKIHIQSSTDARGTDGSVTKTWATHAVRWAKMREISGTETFDSERDYATKVVEFITRYASGAVAKMRISWDSRIFDIQAVVDIDGRKVWHKFVCMERDV